MKNFCIRLGRICCFRTRFESHICASLCPALGAGTGADAHLFNLSAGLPAVRNL